MRWCDIRRLGLQVAKFGIVGGLSTLTHVAAFVVCIESFDIDPLPANLIAYALAVGVGFIGHFNWTFKTRETAAPDWRGPLVRFIIVSLTGLALNSAIVWAITAYFGLSYGYAIPLIVTAVPALQFVLSRQWAFAPEPGRSD